MLAAALGSVDAGPPPHDAGHKDEKEKDAGSPPHDAGPPPRDAGPPPRDAGPPPRDAGPLAPNPSINMSDLKIETADEQSAEGWFTVSNTSGGGNAVQIEAIDMGWEWIGEGGARATCGDVDFAWVRRDTGEVVGPGYVIAPNAEITIDYEIVCNDPAPFAVREIKNFAFIELVGRADVFSSSGGLVIATGG